MQCGDPCSEPCACSGDGRGAGRGNALRERALRGGCMEGAHCSRTPPPRRTHLMISVSTDSRSLGPPEERTDCGTGGKPRLLLAEDEDPPPNATFGRDGRAPRAPPG